MYMCVQPFTIFVRGEVSALDSGLSGLGLSPCQGHYVVLWSRYLSLSQCLSQPSCIHVNGTSEFNAVSNPVMDLHPIQGGVETLLVTSC